jgi:hypothetical protein
MTNRRKIAIKKCISKTMAIKKCISKTMAKSAHRLKREHSHQHPAFASPPVARL